MVSDTFRVCMEPMTNHDTPRDPCTYVFPKNNTREGVFGVHLNPHTMMVSGVFLNVRYKASGSTLSSKRQGRMPGISPPHCMYEKIGVPNQILLGVRQQVENIVYALSISRINSTSTFINVYMQHTYVCMYVLWRSLVVCCYHHAALGDSPAAPVTELASYNSVKRVLLLLVFRLCLTTCDVSGITFQRCSHACGTVCRMLLHIR